MTRKWICKVATFAVRVSDLTAWTKQPFYDLIVLESGFLGLSDEGMNYRDEKRLVSTLKGTQLARTFTRAHTTEEKKTVKSGCTFFNMDLRKHRMCNEKRIGDMCKWVASRGTSSRKT